MWRINCGKMNTNPFLFYLLFDLFAICTEKTVRRIYKIKKKYNVWQTLQNRCTVTDLLIFFFVWRINCGANVPQKCTVFFFQFLCEILLRFREYIYVPSFNSIVLIVSEKSSCHIRMDRIYKGSVFAIWLRNSKMYQIPSKFVQQVLRD